MLQPAAEQYVTIGHIARPHGVKGEVLFIPEQHEPALFNGLQLVRIQNARGDLIPARIETVRTQEKNDRLSFFLKFDHITDRTQAQTLANCAVFTEAGDEAHAIAPPSPQSAGSLVGYAVVDTANSINGEVTDAMDSGAQLILNVQTDRQTVLVPCVDEYVTIVDDDERTLRCKNLDRLVNLI